MAASDKRVLVLGLDMGDGRLIREWCRAGHLPNFARLIDEGTWLELETTAGVLHTSTWPSFATGATPGEHGVYYPYQIRPGLQQAEHIEPTQYQTSTFWAQADRQQRRCLVYDIPETFPEEQYNGRGLFEWGTFAWYGTPAGQPASLMQELKTQFGPYPLGIEAKRLGLKIPESGRLEKRLLRSIAYKRATLQWLLDREDWDLAVAGFCEPHPAGHYLWPEASGPPPDLDDERFESLLRVYRALDEAVGALEEKLPDDGVLLIVSGDGVKPNHCGWHLLPAVMEALGFLCPPPSDSAEGGSKPAGFLARIKAAVPPGARRWIADHLPWWLRDKIGASISAARIDWSRTRAFTLPTDLEGYIRINLKGREPEGLVAPEDYQALCQEIAGTLMELTNPATGQKAVEKVWLRNQVFPGAAQEHLPDLMVVWNGSAPISALESERLGTVAGESPDRRTGTHSTEGFLLASGAGVAAGVSGTGRLIDVGPAVLALLGISAPAGSAGTLYGVTGRPESGVAAEPARLAPESA